ncbi:hypothetical protein NQ318_021793 [Aromia moschata]|uniref:Nuclear-export cofactor Arc1-like N-terminal domain-containing protein n=1 Tax=Aromia moschata TaxID=1265417 RepID=A0AAV8Z6V4_9CUCU|nr:hypothetical protein NQ318_021793 [Aromia moschata]
MTFGDLKTDKGVKELNSFLEDKSYISGYSPSQADIDAVNQLAKSPAANFPHVLRWYNHIKSFSADELKQYGATGASPLKTAATTTAPAKEEDDDDVDLFASDRRRC